MELAGRHFGDLAERSVLDVGCGIGLMESHLVGRFRELVGIDVADQAVEYGVVCGRASSSVPTTDMQLPFRDDRFDIAFAACVMHHVPPRQWPEFLGEMTRVIKPGGLVFIFEHNPFNPLTRIAVFALRVGSRRRPPPARTYHGIVPHGRAAEPPAAVHPLLSLGREVLVGNGEQAPLAPARH